MQQLNVPATQRDAALAGNELASDVRPSASARDGTRWLMLLLVALVMFVNYVDRGNLAIAAPVIQKAMNLDAGDLGVLFSAFAWTYLLCIPLAGVLLDRLGPQITLSVSILGWSLATLFTGMAHSFWQLLACRMVLGIFEAPGIPTNMRCASAWFPQRQRGLAIGLYTAMQPVALAVMAPTVTWALMNVGWRMVFYATGALGLLTALIWQRFYRDPMRSPRVSAKELALIRDGGGLVDTELQDERPRLKWSTLGPLLRERQLIGMFIGQYALMTTLYFFLTWFPLYLANAKGLTTAQFGKYSLFPFLLAICGSLIGGKWSDWMVARGVPLGTARKGPIIVGLLLGTAVIAANYTTDARLVVALMGLAFF